MPPRSSPCQCTPRTGLEVRHPVPLYPLSFSENHAEKTQLPKTGRQDLILKQALASVLTHIFGRGGEEVVRATLKAEGKTPGDPADLWTMSRLLMVAGALKAGLLGLCVG